MTNATLAAALQFLDSWLAYRLRHEPVSGLSVAVGYRNEVIFKGAYGAASLQPLQRLTPQHLFLTASQSKLFTATAVMQLAEAGKLTLDTPLAVYVPWLRQHRDTRFAGITVRQVLMHAAGIAREGPDADYWRLAKPFPGDSELRRLVLQSAITLEPNACLKYSNLGYALLGQVVAAASGRPFAAYLREHCVAPLGLHETFVGLEEDTPAASLATGYGPRYEGRLPPLARPGQTFAFTPVTGIVSTPADMCRFMLAHRLGTGQLLTDASKKEMQRTQQYAASGFSAGAEYGLGFAVLHAGERRLIGHDGHLGGHLSITGMDSQAELVVSAMANWRDAPEGQLIRGIFGIFDFFVRHYGATPLPPERERLNVRLYHDSARLEIVAAGDTIVAISPDDWEPFAYFEELTPVSATTLVVTTPGSLANEGERLQYTFKKGQLQSARFAGISFVPENRYKI